MTIPPWICYCSPHKTESVNSAHPSKCMKCSLSNLLGEHAPCPPIEYCTSGAGQFTPLALKCTPAQNLSINLHLLISLGCITLCFWLQL